MENSYNIGNGTRNSYGSAIVKLKIQSDHEQGLQKELHDYEYKCKHLDNENEQKIIAQNLGWIGKTFGSAENASKNITATLCMLLLLGVTVVSVVVYCYERDISKLIGLWDGVFPIITLSLGYLFGKK